MSPRGRRCISKNSSALHNLLLQSPRLFSAIPVVISFDFLLNLLHLFRLPLPFGLARLRLSAEQLIVRLSTATTQSVPPRGELPVSVVEVQVVHCVACSTVDDEGIGYVFAVVYNNQSATYYTQRKEKINHECKSQKLVKAKRPTSYKSWDDANSCGSSRCTDP